jgi:hypothetical protein
MFTIFGLLIAAILVLAILSAVKPYPVLWVAVLLCGIVFALEHFGQGTIR